MIGVRLSHIRHARKTSLPFSSARLRIPDFLFQVLSWSLVCCLSEFGRASPLSKTALLLHDVTLLHLQLLAALPRLTAALYRIRERLLPPRSRRSSQKPRRNRVVLRRLASQRTVGGLDGLGSGEGLALVGAQENTNVQHGWLHGA